MVPTYKYEAKKGMDGFWSMPKPRVKPKTMICVWWDWEDMVHWEKLERNATINKELYIAQLHHVNEAIQLKRPH